MADKPLLSYRTLTLVDYVLKLLDQRMTTIHMLDREIMDSLYRYGWSVPRSTIRMSTSNPDSSTLLARSVIKFIH